MKFEFLILLMSVIYSCNNDEFNERMTSSELNEKRTEQSVELFNTDSSFCVDVLFSIDTNIAFDSHLVLKNDMIYNQRINIIRNGRSKKISIPYFNNPVDTVKKIGDKECKFYSNVIQNVYIDEYKTGESILSIKYAGFNNGSDEVYFFFNSEGIYLGEINCKKNGCDTIGLEILNKLEKPVKALSKSIFE